MLRCGQHDAVLAAPLLCIQLIPLSCMLCRMQKLLLCIGDWDEVLWRVLQNDTGGAALDAASDRCAVPDT